MMTRTNRPDFTTVPYTPPTRFRSFPPQGMFARPTKEFPPGRYRINKLDQNDPIRKRLEFDEEDDDVIESRSKKGKIKLSSDPKLGYISSVEKKRESLEELFKSDSKES